MLVFQTAILSEAVTSSWILGVPGPVASRTASRSMMVRAGTSRTVSHSGLTYMVTGSIPRRTSQAKASIVPSSRVASVKEGVTYCTPRVLVCVARVWPGR